MPTRPRVTNAMSTQFTSFGPPSPAPSKKNFLQRLFGWGSAEDEEPQPPRKIAISAPGQAPHQPPPPPSPHASSSSPSQAQAQSQSQSQPISHSPHHTAHLASPPHPHQQAGRHPTPTRARSSSGNASGTTRATDMDVTGAEMGSGHGSDLVQQIKQRQEDHKYKEFWMDDASVPMCYECEIPFSMLVRRHHCRTCGQIFCSKCTRKTAPGEFAGYDAAIRVCHFCSSILQNTPLGADITEIIDSAKPALENKKNGVESDSSEEGEAADEELLSTTYSRVSLQHIVDKVENERRRSAKRDKRAAAQNGVPQAKPLPESPGDSVPWLDLEDDGDDAINAIEYQGDGIAGGTGGISSVGQGNNPSSEGSPRFKSDPGTSIDAASIRRVQSQIRRVFSFDKLSLPNATPEKTKPAASAHSSSAPASSSTASSSESSSASSQSMSSSVVDKEEELPVSNETLLIREGQAHLRRLCTYLLKHYTLDEKWTQVVMDLVRQVVSNIRPHVKFGDKMDPRYYVKIKKICGGSLDECTYVDGIAFTKNRAHKKQRSDIKNARVLLLGCSVEFERKEQRLVSFDKLLVQEREYLKILVSKIASMKPDVVLVEKSISRPAQDMLVEAGICFAVNVKPHLMHVVARISQCTILQSTEHVLNAKIGVVGHFRIETFTGPWGKKPVMTFAGCPKHLYATVILRGAPDPVLSKIKSVLRFMVYAAWTIRLESSLIIDESGTAVRHDSPAVVASDPSSTPSISSASSSSSTATITTMGIAAVNQNSKGMHQEDGMLCCSWSVIVPAEFSNGKGKKGYNIMRLESTASSPESPAAGGNETKSEELNAAAHDAAAAAAPAPEITQYQVCPTLLRTPMHPELALSSTMGKDTHQDHSSQLALNFSYRTLLTPAPSRSVDEQHHQQKSHRANSMHSSKLANKLRFGDQTKFDKITDQFIIYLHALFCTTTSSQCTPHEWQIINFYSQNDMTLGQFLENYCFSPKMKCSLTDCHKPVVEHERCFMHHDGRLNVAVRPWPQNLINTALPQSDSKSIYMWAYCKQFNRQTPFMVPMSPDAWSYSFGKYLELYFYSQKTMCRSCQQPLYRDHIRYFYHDNKVAIFEYEPVKVMEVAVPSMKMRLNDTDQRPLMEQEVEDIIYLHKRIHERLMAKLAELDDCYGTSDLEEKEEIMEYRKLQEKEKIAFMDKIRQEQDKVNTNATNVFQINSLRRLLYGNVKTWHMMITEHELKFQKKQKLRKSEYSSPSSSQHYTLAPSKSDEHGAGRSRSSSASSDKGAGGGGPTDTISIPVPTPSLSATTSTASTPTQLGISDGTSPGSLHSVETAPSNSANPSPSPSSLEDSVHLVESTGTLTEVPVSSGALSPTTESAESSSSAQSQSLAPSPSPSSSPSPRSLSGKIPRSSSSDSLLNADKEATATTQQAGKMTVPDFSALKRSTDKDPIMSLSPNLTGTTPPASRSGSSNSSSAPPAPMDARKSTILDAVTRIVNPNQAKTPITDVLEDSTVHIFAGGSNSSRQSCVAVYEDEPSSIISFALNSEEYEQKLQQFNPSTPMPSFMDEAYRSILSPANTTISNEWKSASVWGGPKIRMSCTTHFAHQFTWLRRLVGLSEERFSLSLSRCRTWHAQGGKAGGKFVKTLDQRFVLKTIQSIELQSFLAFAPLYFDYFSKVYFQQVPTSIAKIVGIYSVSIKTPRKEEKFDIIVMENLFYGHNITKTFDLKGSLRSRYAIPNKSNEVVFLDENLLELMYADPICVSTEAKALLGMTVWNDTLCLSSLNVMDYSLLVGIDEEKQQLVVGIIDYMRTYTWDKQLETWVKKTGILGGAKKVPTIISPKQYKKRFRNAIWNYFIVLPNLSTSVHNGGGNG